MIASSVTSPIFLYDRERQAADKTYHIDLNTHSRLSSNLTSSSRYKHIRKVNNMPHSKTPGQSNAASDKFNKQDAEGARANGFDYDYLANSYSA
jgi:hypothetical protein